MLQRFDLDEEDLGLLRAEGIKRMDDFRRIKKLDELHLPSGELVCLPLQHSGLACDCAENKSAECSQKCAVTKQKVGELIASLPNDGQDSAMSKFRKSLGGLMDSLSGYLPSTPVKGAADTAASTSVSKALKPKGERRLPCRNWRGGLHEGAAAAGMGQSVVADVSAACRTGLVPMGAACHRLPAAQVVSPRRGRRRASRTRCP